MARGHDAPYSFVFAVPGSAGGLITGTANLGAESFYYQVPSQPNGEGIVIRRAVAKAAATAGGSVVIDIQKGTTSVLSSTVTISNTTATTLTLASDGSERCAAGSVISIDVTAGTLAATTSVRGLCIQVDFDRLGRGD